MGVDDVGTQAQHDIKHAQGEQQGCYTLHKEVPTDVGHPRTMALHAGSTQFRDKLGGIVGSATQYLHYMIFHAFCGRRGYIGSHTLGTAKIKMGN